jgi:hypothetical protein
MYVTALIVVAGGAEPPTSGNASQAAKNEGASASAKDSPAKTLADLNRQINDLKDHIRMLETEEDELRTRLVQVELGKYTRADLSDATSELARFDCESDFNRAHSLALAQGVQGYTLEGAAALNCTQRLAKITEKAVRSLESH